MVFVREHFGEEFPHLCPGDDCRIRRWCLVKHPPAMEPPTLKEVMADEPTDVSIPPLRWKVVRLKYGTRYEPADTKETT